MSMEEKTEKENPHLNVVSLFPDAVHVANINGRTLVTWFSWVQDVRVSLVEL